MPRTWFDYPIRIDGRGALGDTDWNDHVRDMIYQALFTAPGERVNRPDFGCGVQRLLFMGNNQALATATQFLVQGSLQRWLGDLIQLDDVELRHDEERLVITVVYTRRDNRERHHVGFTVSSAGSR